ncbi:PREDICTED: kinesin-like protein KIF18A [Nicrophorus vespilloides]|uniref:Kinesin-like protein n=1 Tax=Nicrophorus vespilloides TaxID=110193 RepID=A0ABM1N3V6_NICVS|nr:PREDICTED: kinesin-like protein KIF18A [Nicrophorus vespilloides]
MVKNRKDLTPRRGIRGTAVKSRVSAGANIRVVVRVRPQNAKETGENFRTVVKVSDEQMLMFDPEEDSTPFFYHGVQQKGRDLLKKPHKNMKFLFDRVFPPIANNEEVFVHSTKDLIETLMDGCNCSVFVYGATGAGKTHTMLGHNGAPGITYLTMRELFHQKQELTTERDFELAVSYLEVYNENVQDLLQPKGSPLHLREDSKLGVMVAGITLKRIENPEDLFELLEKGNKNRTQHPTDANAESSRSHAVFQVYIRMKVKQTGQTRLAKLSMIDLAGSERGAATGCKGARFTEGANINKSLLALGNCINSLADGQRHVPYRDSKLTRLLKDSLGGNCHTVMIANVSPSSMSFEDTYNTLKYATRAKKIKSNVKKNVVNNELNASHYIKVIEELNKEILQLKEAAASSETACTKCKNNDKPMKQEVEVVDSSEMPTKLKTLFDEYIMNQERYQKLHSNHATLDYRLNLKDETNSRLSDFCVDSREKEKGHKKLVHTIETLKKQNNALVYDLDSLEKTIARIEEEIQNLVEAAPDLKMQAELEQCKVDNMKMKYQYQELQGINKLQSVELNTRGALMENMGSLLQPWYYILDGHNMMTDDMRKKYTDLRGRLQGECNVTFDDADSGLSTSSSSSNITTVEKDLRPLKRKLSEDMDSTFILGSSTNSKNAADYMLSKVCEPSPAKKLAKSAKLTSQIVLKENRPLVRKAVGTMGTASRFPGALSSITCKTTNKYTSKHLLAKQK